MSQRPRAGFVLPLVIVVSALTMVVALGTTTAAWRAYRASQTALIGQRALYAAEAAIESQVTTWGDSVISDLTLGGDLQQTVLTAAGDTVDVRVRRTHPMVVWLIARARLESIGAPVRVAQAVTRVLRLAPPHLPLAATATILGNADIPSAAVFSGSDQRRPGDPCGPYRDTASVHAVAVARRTGDTTRTAPAFSDVDSLRGIVQRAWPRLTQRSIRSGPTVTPWVLEPSPSPAARLLVGDSVIIAGASHWRGLLAIDGALIVEGTLTIDGVLVVRGHLDTRAGTLIVHGGLLVVDQFDRGSALSGRDRVTYDGCAVPLALATVANARSEPFFLWHSTPP